VARTLIGRIARHPSRPGRDEREDRLTEVFASVLDHPECSGLAQFVVEQWLRDELRNDDVVERDRFERLVEQFGQGDWQCRVRTQVFSTIEEQNRRPDLELRFSRRGSRDILVCVEVKHGTAPHTRQLHAYVAAQAKQASAEGVVVVLAPRNAYLFPDNEIPASVPQLRWQDTAVIVGSYQTRSVVAEFLVRELQSYLSEEGLMDPDRLTPEHLVAFDHHKEAFSALSLVCEQADAYVVRAWARPDPDYSGYSAGETWWVYPLSPKGPSVAQAWKFAWHLFEDSTRIFRDGRAGAPRFAAGASAARGELMTLPASKRDALRDGDFELLSKPELKYGEYDYVWRLAYPVEVVVGSSIQTQGQALGRWMVDSFQRAATALAED
jgi:hypothetical protein